MEKKNVITSCNLPKDLRDQAQEHAKIYGIHFSQVMREALTEYLAKYAAKEN